MIFTRLLLIAFALSSLTTVYAGKLLNTKTNANATEIEPTKTELSSAIVHTEKSSEENDEDNVAEKNALKPADDTSLSVWSIVRGVWNWIKDDISESLFGDNSATNTGEVRTFGKIRRLQMALIPIIFKVGLLTAMVAFLVMLGLKILLLVKILFLMNAAVLLSKFFTLKSNIGHTEHYAAPHPTWNWTPYMNSGWQSDPVEPAAIHPSKEIHLHIHGAQGQPQISAHSPYGNVQSSQNSGWERRSDPYRSYITLALQPKQNDAQNELTNAGSVQQQANTNYPSNHRLA